VRCAREQLGACGGQEHVPTVDADETVRQRLTAAILFAVAAVIAGLVRGGAFLGSLRITALSVGALLLLMAGTGGAFSRAADADARQSALGRLPGLPSWTESRPEEPTLSSSAVFAISGVALLVLGLMVA
jgi:hypothetical protein